MVTTSKILFYFTVSMGRSKAMAMEAVICKRVFRLAFRQLAGEKNTTMMRAGFALSKAGAVAHHFKNMVKNMDMVKQPHKPKVE